MAAGCRAGARRSQEKFSIQPWKFVLNGSSHRESEIELILKNEVDHAVFTGLALFIPLWP
jgi:hypothetical protein